MSFSFLIFLIILFLKSNYMFFDLSRFYFSFYLFWIYKFFLHCNKCFLIFGVLSIFTIFYFFNCCKFLFPFSSLSSLSLSTEIDLLKLLKVLYLTFSDILLIIIPLFCGLRSGYSVCLVIDDMAVVLGRFYDFLDLRSEFNCRFDYD